MQRERSLWVLRLVHHDVEVDKLEVVEAAFGQLFVEVFHGVPGAVTHADHDDRQGPVGGFHDSVSGIALCSHLPIGHDDQNVKLRYYKTSTY